MSLNRNDICHVGVILFWISTRVWGCWHEAILGSFTLSADHKQLLGISTTQHITGRAVVAYNAGVFSEYCIGEVAKKRQHEIPPVPSVRKQYSTLICLKCAVSTSIPFNKTSVPAVGEQMKNVCREAIYTNTAPGPHPYPT